MAIEDENNGEAVAEDANPLLNENVAEAAAVQRKRQKLRTAEKHEAEFWRQAMSSEVGRKAIWNLLDQAHTFSPRFACGPNGFPQAEATWHALGEQSFGLRFYHMLARNDRVALLKMHDENDPYYASNSRPKELN